MPRARRWSPSSARFMNEVAKAAAKYVAARAEEWEAAAHQLDGRAAALEAQSARLEEVRKAVVRAAKAQ